MRTPAHFAILAAMHLPFAPSFGSDTAPKEKPPDEPAWGAPVEGFRLSLRATEKKYAAREKVEVQLVLQNADTREREIVLRHPLAIFTIQVIDPKGKEVPMTAQGKELEDVVKSGFRATEEMKPNEEHPFDLELSEVYNLDQPGKYQITARLKVSNRKDESKFSTVISNSLTLTIISAKANKKR